MYPNDVSTMLETNEGNEYSWELGNTPSFVDV